MYEKTITYRILNNSIHAQLIAVLIKEKIWEHRLCWFGHVQRQSFRCDRIYYKHEFIRCFISEQGKILFKRVNKLTLLQQRVDTIAIKQACILSLYCDFANVLKEHVVGLK